MNQNQKTFKEGQRIWYFFSDSTHSINSVEGTKIGEGDLKSFYPGISDLAMIESKLIKTGNFFATKNEATLELIRRISENIRKLQELAGQLRENL